MTECECDCCELAGADLEAECDRLSGELREMTDSRDFWREGQQAMSREVERLRGELEEVRTIAYRNMLGEAYYAHGERESIARAEVLEQALEDIVTKGGAWTRTMQDIYDRAMA